MSDTTLAFDLGTTNFKAALFDEDGRRIAIASTPSSLIRSRGPDGAERVEVDVNEYWDLLVASTRKLAEAFPEEIAHLEGIGFATQAQTFAPLGGDGEPMRRGISWLDARAVSEAALLADALPLDEFYRRSGFNEFSPALMAAKVLWLQRNDAAAVNGVWKYAHLRDYLAMKLTGELALDTSLAALGGLYNPDTDDFSTEILRVVQLDRARLPRLVHPTETIGTMTATAAQATGLPLGVPVVAGCLDQLAAGLGTGNVAPGRLSENTGTCATQFTTLDGEYVDCERRMLLGRHAAPGLHYLLPYIPTAGAALEWFGRQVAREIAGGADWQTLTREAAEVPPGAEGVLFTPHFVGESSPVIVPRERGQFAGLSVAHRRGHLFRAMLEGIAFAVAENVEMLEQCGVVIDEVYSFGGAASNELWTQIKADCLNRALTIPEETEASALGAAVLAAARAPERIGETAHRFCRARRIVEPDAERVSLYAERRATWRRLLAFAREAQSIPSARPV